jgi:hypothetical protein
VCPGDYWASPSIAGLPHRAGLISGFCSSAPSLASGFLPTPPHGDAVAFSSRFPSPGLAGDLHPQHQRHAWHTKINSAIGALLSADELLTRSTAHTAELRDILAVELRPYDVSRIAVVGEPVMLAPNLARAFALITHELATNAAKYGALSQPQGRLCVSWTIADRRIQVPWAEENGPVVVPPVRQGFGSHLFERLLSGFEGSVGTEFRTCGLVCEISFSLPV